MWVRNPLALIKACCVLAVARWLTNIMAVLLFAPAGSSLRSRPVSPGRSAQTPLLDATFALSLFALVTKTSGERSELSAAFSTKRRQSLQNL